MEYNSILSNEHSLKKMWCSTSIYSKVYFFLFFLFSLQVVPNDILIALIVLVFLAENLENDIYLYMFSLPWMYVGKFSFGLTISLVNTILLVSKIAINRKKIEFTNLDLVVFAYLLTIGIFALVLNQTFTGISICFYFLIAVYIHSTYAKDKERCEFFWEKSLFFIFLSTSIAVIYGIRAETGYERWIVGMGYVSQLYGTLGTSRFGLYLVVSLLYPLYYVHNKFLKTILLILLAVAVFETVSMTAFLLLIFAFVFYTFMKGEWNVKKTGALLLVALVVALAVLFWDQIGNIDVIKPLYTRTSLITTELQTGDMDAATSGRSSLSDLYIERFESFNVFNKLTGSAMLSATEDMYSHNSYLDMLNYCGIIGVILLALLQIQRIWAYLQTSVKRQALLTKFLFILAAASVSIFSAQYWLIFFFL